MFILQKIPNPVVYKGQDCTYGILAYIVGVFAGRYAGIHNELKAAADIISGWSDWNNRGEIVRNNLIESPIF
jgi:hypothetical protein